MSDTPAERPSEPTRGKLARSRRRRLQARQAKAERNVKLFNLLKSGVPIAEIALQEGVSARRAREMVQQMLERREVDPPAGFAQLQIGRLSDAMMVAYAAMMDGNLQALDRVLRIIGELDRRHGLVGVSAAPGADAPRALSPPALALPAPAETAELSPAKD